MGSYMSAGEAYDEAIRQGATPEQIKQATRIAGVGGATEPLPIEIILNRIPMPLVGKAVGIMGRLLAKAAAEGGQEVLQQGIQNFSENYAYNPDQDLTEGMVTAFGIGSLVGGTFAGAVELGGGEAAPAPAPGAAAAAGAGATVGGAAGAITPPPPGGAAAVPLDEDDLAPLPAGLDEEVVIGEPLEEEVPAPPAAAETVPVAPEPIAATAAPAAELTSAAVPAVTAASGPTRDQLRQQFTIDDKGTIDAPAVANHLTTTATQALAAGKKFTIFPEKGKGVDIVGLNVNGMMVDAKGQAWGSMPLLMTNTNDFPVFEIGAAPAEVPELDLAPFGQPIGTRRHPAAPEFAGTRVNQGASDAQRAVRNAEVGHYRWQPGVHVSIEVPVGAERHAIEPGRAPEQEPAWRAPLPQGVAYGRIRGTRDRTGRNIKTFVGPTPEAGEVYVIDQVNPDTGAYDQPKVMLDFASLEDARNAYVSSYSDGRGAERLGSISAMPIADFKTWMKTKRTQRPFDRKATAESRRLRQAATAAAKQTAAAQAEQAADAQAMEGLTDAEKATVETEAPRIREPGEPGAEPGPEYAQPDQASADQERVPGEELPGGGAIAGEPGEARQPVPEAGAVAGEEEVRPTGQPGGEAAGQVTEQLTDGGEDSQAIRGYPQQAEQEDELRRGARTSGQNLQRGPEAQEQPSDRASLGEGREEGPQQEVAAPAPDLAARWDKLPLEQKEELLKAAKVARSPITRWKDFGEANQQKLRAAETPQEAVSEKQASKVKPTQKAEPTLADQFEDIAAAQNEALGIIQRIAGRIRVNFKDALDPTNAEGWGGARATEGPVGTFEFWRKNGRMVRRLIEVSLDQSPADIQNTAFHEAWHAIERAIGRANLRVLKAEMPRLRKLVAAEFRRLKITDIDASKLSEQEVMAIAFARYGQGRVRGIHTGIRRYFEAVKQFLRRLGNALRSGDFKTAEDVFGSAYAGEFAGPLSKQDLSLFEHGKANVQASLSYPRRPPRAPDPAATWAMPGERRVLEEVLGEHGNLSLWNRRIANRVEAFARADPALQQTGVSDTLSLVEAEGRYSGSTSAAAEQLKHRYREPIFKALRAITGPTRTNDVSADFADYLYAMHSYHEANPYLRTINKTIGDPSGMSDAEALDIIHNAHPEFHAIAQMVWAMNKESLRTMRANKTISQETFDELNKQQYWVPLRGWQEAEGDDFFSTGRGFDLRSPEFKTRMGRESKADNPLAYSLLAANTAIDRAGKNRVLRVLHRLIIERPNKDVWERNRAVKERYRYTDPKTGAVSIKERWIPPQRVDMSRTVVVREDGVPYYLTLHDELDAGGRPQSWRRGVERGVPHDGHWGACAEQALHHLLADLRLVPQPQPRSADRSHPAGGREPSGAALVCHQAAATVAGRDVALLAWPPEAGQ